MTLSQGSLEFRKGVFRSCGEYIRPGADASIGMKGRFLAVLSKGKTMGCYADRLSRIVCKPLRAIDKLVRSI